MRLFSRKCRWNLFPIRLIDTFSCTKFNTLFRLNSLHVVFVELEGLAGACVDQGAGSSIADSSIMLVRFNALGASMLI